jgi:hypothetical protein
MYVFVFKNMYVDMHMSITTSAVGTRVTHACTRTAAIIYEYR